MESVACVLEEAGLSMNVYGFDLSSRKVAGILLRGEGEPEAFAMTTKKLESRAKELFSLWRQIDDLLTQNEPEYVYIEAPVVGRGGARPTILQSQVDGLVQSAAVKSSAVGVYSVNNKTWKKAVVGNGNATKQDTSAWLAKDHPVLSELAGDDQDLVDAAGVAVYGKLIVTRAGQRTLRLDP
jgi:Holliday junction resolvasome RuvABC endonuclease subunit